MQVPNTIFESSLDIAAMIDNSSVGLVNCCVLLVVKFECNQCTEASDPTTGCCAVLVNQMLTVNSEEKRCETQREVKWRPVSGNIGDSRVGSTGTSVISS